MSTPLWAYVVVFDGMTVPEFTKAIDQYNDEIVNWLTVLPQTVFIVSPKPAAGLTDFLRSKLPKLGRMLVLDAKTDRNGWLPRSAWEFLSNPSPPKKAGASSSK
jgi:hypothetical protein